MHAASIAAPGVRLVGTLRGNDASCPDPCRLKHLLFDILLPPSLIAGGNAPTLACAGKSSRFLR